MDKGALVTGLHMRPADIEEYRAQEADLKDIKHSLREASQGGIAYMDLRGDSSTGELNQQEQVPRLMRLEGDDEARPVFRRTSMAPARPNIPQ